MRYIVSLLVITVFSSNILSQQTSNWKNYSDMKNASGLVSTAEGLWAATKGGAYFYKFSDKSYQTFNKTEGFSGTTFNCVGIDKQNKAWFGSSTGMIDVYDPSTASTRSIPDIFNTDKTNKSINNITIAGDTVFIATDFGISLISSRNYFFYDTYFRFGTFSSNIKVYDILVDNLIYAATESGVAVQKAGTTNLSAPESWNVYTQSNGLPAGNINKLVKYGNNILAATSGGVYLFNGTDWTNYLPAITGNVIDMFADNLSLYVLTTAKLFLYDGNNVSEVKSFSVTPSRVNYSQVKGLFIATNKGVMYNDEFLFPDGPAANQFPNMTVDREGNFWSASGKDVSGVGLYKYDGNKWEIYNTAKYPDLYTNAFYSVYCGSDNSIYGGSWGQGFVKINSKGITRYHSGNSPMIGILQNLNFVVITSFAEDSKNNLWILNLRPADKKSIYLLTKDSVWYAFGNPVEQYGDFTEFKNLVIDNNGTKWYPMTNEGNLGLYYYNEKGTYSNLSDDVYGYVSTSKGLTSNDVFSLAVDRRGDLWVGTNLGVSIITNTDAVLNSTNPQFKISTSFSVRQQSINCIVVDPLNQKWLGTNQGLMLLNSDGTQLLKTLNTKNSPLPSDKIVSLAIDEKSGRMYVGTDAGLTSFDTPSIMPAESFNGLTIYPNPLKLNDGSKLVTIDGLIRNSDIKIVTVSGKLVRQFSSPGGRTAFWDGKDDNGNLVNSGVYIVIAFDQEGNSVETGKIAVIRE